MKIYVCWSSTPKYLNHEHPCGIAHEAVVEAGYDPEVVKAYGWAILPEFMNKTRGRQEVKELTGQLEVPVLQLDDGKVITGSQEIIAWAKSNPAGVTTAA